MSSGCTNCGRKDGCSHRKGDMFAAIDGALAALYPDRRWGQRVDPAPPDLVAADEGPALAQALSERLEALALHRPGALDETCDYVYVLCFGRHPSLLEVREGLVPAELATAESAGGDLTIDELYLRVALSTLGPFAAVQQVAMRGVPGKTDLLIEEDVRAGVFDPVLLARFRKLVSVLDELGVRNLDMGDIAEPPSGFHAGDYGERYGGVPAIANYLFYPQPCSSITTSVVPFGAAPVAADRR